MKNLKKLEPILALGIIIAFFLPWVKIPDFGTIAGYNIVNAANEINTALDLEKASNLLYIIYGIPLLSLVIIITALLNKDVKYISIFTGLFILMISITTFIYTKHAIIQLLDIGLYLTLIFAIGLILSPFLKLDVEK